MGILLVFPAGGKLFNCTVSRHTHSCEDYSRSVSGIPSESLPYQVPQIPWWENLFSVSHPVTGFPSTLPLSKAHGFYGKTEGVIGSNWRSSFWWLELLEIAPVVVMFPQVGWWHIPKGVSQPHSCPFKPWSEMQHFRNMMVWTTLVSESIPDYQPTEGGYWLSFKN